MTSLFFHSDSIILDGEEANQLDGAAGGTPGLTQDGVEEVLVKIRAKLFEFDATNSTWKTKATGDATLLQSYKQTRARVRFVMREDKSFRICANHWITQGMELQPNIGSDRSWVWKVDVDLAEQPPRSQSFAIRFASSEKAVQFKQVFELAQKGLDGSSSDLLQQLDLLRVERDRIDRHIALLEAQLGDGK